MTINLDQINNIICFKAPDIGNCFLHYTVSLLNIKASFKCNLTWDEMLFFPSKQLLYNDNSAKMAPSAGQVEYWHYFLSLSID